MQVKALRILCLFLMLCLFPIFISSCGRPEKKLAPNNENTEQSSAKTQKPKELEEITTNIESIIENVEQKSSSQSGGESGGSSNNQGGSEQQNQDQKDPLKDWQEEEKMVKEIHKKWNPLEIEVVKSGAGDNLRNEFELNLDSLTDQIMSQNVAGTLTSANELYGSASKIAGLFQTNNPPQADMLKYYTRKTLLFVEAEEWIAAQEMIGSITQQWDKVKTMLGEKNAGLTAQMDYAIRDLSNSIDKENKEVTKIKIEIIMDNIEKIVKEIEEN
ncbi:MAG: hypothetical protein PHY90_09240 [Desulfitobacteriaceae bacterium]|nr:hypothetical protein [Desulfitobacteriaceae bacterium]